MIHESGTGPTRTYGLTAANNGTKQFYIGLIFAPKYHPVAGPADRYFYDRIGHVACEPNSGRHAGSIKQSKGPGRSRRLVPGPGTPPLRPGSSDAASGDLCSIAAPEGPRFTPQRGWALSQLTQTELALVETRRAAASSANSRLPWEQ